MSRDLVRLAVDSADVAALRFGIDVRRIARIGEHPEAVAAVEILPLRLGDAAGKLRLADPRAVVLESAVHLVRLVHVDAHVVELRDRQRLRLPPLVPGIVGVPQAAVVADDQMIGVLRIDPHVVEVAVRRAADVAERRAAVGAHDERAVRLVDAILVLGIDDEIREVEWTPQHVLAAIAELPRRAAIVGAIQPVERRHRFDECVHDVGLGRRHGDGDASPGLGGQSLRALVVERGPCRAAISTLE